MSSSKPLATQSFTFESVPPANAPTRGIAGSATSKKKPVVQSPAHHSSPPASAPVEGVKARNPQSRRYQQEPVSSSASSSLIPEPAETTESELRTLLLQASKMRDSLHSAVLESRSNQPQPMANTLTPDVVVVDGPTAVHSDPQNTSSRRFSVDDEVVAITEEDLSRIDDPETLAFLEANSGWLVRYMQQGDAAADSDGSPIISDPPTSVNNDPSGGAFFLTAIGNDGREYHVCMHDDVSAADIDPTDNRRAPSVASMASRRALQIPVDMLPPEIHKKHPALFSDPTRYHRRAESASSIRSSVMSLASVAQHIPDSRDDSVVFGDLADDDEHLLAQELADVNAALYGTLLLRKEQDYIDDLPDTPEGMLAMLESQVSNDEAIPDRPPNQASSSNLPVAHSENVDDYRALAAALESASDMGVDDDDDDVDAASDAPTTTASETSRASKALRNRESLRARREKISQLLDLMQERNRKAREHGNSHSGNGERSSSTHDAAIQRLIGQTFVTQLDGSDSQLNVSVASALSAASSTSSGGVTDEQLEELREAGEEAFARRLDALRQKHALKRRQDLEDINKEWLRQQQLQDPNLPRESTSPNLAGTTVQGQPASNRSAFTFQHCGRKIAAVPVASASMSSTSAVSKAAQEGIERAAARAQGKKLTDSESRRVDFLLDAYGSDSDFWFETPDETAKRVAEEAAMKAKLDSVDKGLARMVAVRSRVLRLQGGSVKEGSESELAASSDGVRELNAAMNVSDSVRSLLLRLRGDDEESSPQPGEEAPTSGVEHSNTAKALGNKYLHAAAEETRRKARLRAINEELERIQRSMTTLTTAPYSFLKSTHADPSLLYGPSRDMDTPLSECGGIPTALPPGIELPDEPTIQTLLAAARQEEAIATSRELDEEAPESPAVTSAVPFVPSTFQEMLRERLRQASQASDECASMLDDLTTRYATQPEGEGENPEEV